MLNTKITPFQKLQAIELKHYQHQKWQPKVGDFYTINRADLKLFQIVREEDGFFIFICNEYDGENAFEVQGFADEGFGMHRVHVPEWVLKQAAPEGFYAHA